MPINFIPNDPRAKNGPPTRTISPRADRPAGRAGFVYSKVAAEGTFDPGTPEFLFWQCREGALAALEAWERVAGDQKSWIGSKKKLKLLQDAGDDLNAFYDRNSLSFFHKTVGGKTYFSGASTDVVAHEAGHGLLDAIKPGLFAVNFFEAAAFHEGFGDIVALLTALADKPTREKVLADLNRKNFVESTAEELSDGILRLMKTLPASQQPQIENPSKPRRALNKFQWAFPGTLPQIGPPETLINEIHSFGQVISGCFYDTIRNIFAGSGGTTEADLQNASETAGKLIVTAVTNAPIVPRFFQEVGRAMIQADEADGGVNGDAIRNAFGAHGITLGTSAAVSPLAAIEGAAPSVTSKVAKISAVTRRALLNRISAAPGAKLSIEPLRLAGKRMVNAIHQREVSLSGLHSKLKGVVAFAEESVIVGSVDNRAAIFGSIPQADIIADEVRSFVSHLMDHQAVAFDGKKSDQEARKVGRRVPTHVIKSKGGKKVLTRIRFSCSFPDEVREA